MGSYILSTNVIRAMTIQDKVDNMTHYADAVRSMPPPTQLPPRLTERQVTAQSHSNNIRGQTTDDKVASTTHRTQESANRNRSPPRGQYRRHDDQDRQLKRTSSRMSVNSVHSASSSNFEFPAAHKRKQRRHAKAVVGTGTSDSVKGAPEPSRDIFVFRVDKETNADTLKLYMNNKNINVREIELKSNDQAIYSSFHVRIQVSDLDSVLQPDFWPVGVNVRRYWTPKIQHTQSWK
jgi:hypothetical protein